MKLPVHPVKGYSITVSVTCPEAAPVSTVMDETFKVAITRLGDRIRVGGPAELARFNLRLRRPCRCMLEHSVRNLFADAGDIERASFWIGLRPMTPDGKPMVGSAPLAGMFTNTGHGTPGWTMSCGSARVLAPFISGPAPGIESCNSAISRYNSAISRYAA